MVFIMASHIITCLWVFVAVLESNDDPSQLYVGTWLEKKKDLNGPQIYCLAFYWVMTTLTTVGYGDITISNGTEQIFCIILMVCGVVWFAAINGIIFNMLQVFNITNAELLSKLTRLNELKQKYDVTKKLYIDCKHSLEYS